MFGSGWRATRVASAAMMGLGFLAVGGGFAYATRPSQQTAPKDLNTPFLFRTTRVSGGYSPGPLPIKLSNGVQLELACRTNPDAVVIRIDGLSNRRSGGLQISGTALSGASPVAKSYNSPAISSVTVLSDAQVSFDGVVYNNDSPLGGWLHVDLHGFHDSPCIFWGVITPVTT